MYNIISHLQIVTVWLLLYQSGCLVFLCLVLLLWLAPPVFCWITGESGHPCLVPSQKRKSLQLLTVQGGVGCGFITYGLYYVEVLSLYTHFVESFYHEWMLNFVEGLFSIYGDDHVVFVLFFLCGGWCWWIFKCCTILASLRWIPLGHVISSFCCIFEFGLLIFSWVLLHLCSSGI